MTSDQPKRWLPGPEGPEFFNSDFRFRFLAKKYNSKVFFFFSYSDQNIVKFDVKVKKHTEMTTLVKCTDFLSKSQI